MNVEEVKELCKGKRVGFTCSCFDLLHSGHVKMLENARSQCDVLVVGLQTDPTLDRKHKNKPVQSFEERKIMISAIRYVDYVIEYSYEKELYELIKTLQPDVRILGSDYVNKPFTGDDLGTFIHYHKRDHPWSTSNLRKRIWEAEEKKLRSSKKQA